MNWKEFKDYIESEGVTDDMDIERIFYIKYEFKHLPRVSIYPNYKTCNPEKYKTVVID